MKGNITMTLLFALGGVIVCSESINICSQVEFRVKLRYGCLKTWELNDKNDENIRFYVYNCILYYYIRYILYYYQCVDYHWLNLTITMCTEHLYMICWSVTDSYCVFQYWTKTTADSESLATWLHSLNLWFSAIYDLAPFLISNPPFLFLPDSL